MLVVYSHFFDAFAASNNIGPSPFGFNLLTEGKIGVSLFCVVSGFIFEFIVRGRAVNYKRFMGARLWRIYPLYVIVLVIAAAAFKQSTIGLAVQLLTALPAFNSGDVWSATWSLVVEFQFYLIFPFLTLLLARDGKRQLALIILFFFMVRGLMWGIGMNVNAISYNTMLGRAPQFLCGMIAARMFYDGRSGFAKSPAFLAVTVLAILASTHYYHVSFGAKYPWFQVPYTSFFSVIWPDLQAVLFAALILSFLQVRLPSCKPVAVAFRYIGKVSFSIYLMHRMVEYVISKKTEFHIPLQWTGNVRLDGFISCTVLEIPLVIAVATITYYAIEHPFQAFKKDYLPLKADGVKVATPAREAVI